ncbi:hypothetical protein ASD00_26790 [Ensifer sp. Root31]|uniref:hypothetical protein n=1 Tax=Ensifer sp. Root31 TaxID=1736512 RepID=UPI00070F1C2D|nr:hypothetical protein [Ensifer sp. Root31]KQU89465.1 hypothetical protein ASD00_26790 [Ensifer sp. Root31]
MSTDQKPDLLPVLQAVAERIHYAETRRSNFTVIAGVLLAGGVALLGLIAGKRIDAVLAYPLWVSAISFTILGIVIFVAYARQTNLYPWTSATRTWKWFYRDALPDEKAFSSSIASNVYVSTKERTRAQSEYNRQLPLFMDRLSDLSDDKVNHEQDQEQLYVLHINEKYKNLYLSGLRSILNRGVLAWVTFSIIALAVGAYQDYHDSRPHTAKWTSGNLDIRGEWLAHTLENGTEEILLNVDISNRGKALADLPQWGLTTDEGLLVPLEISKQTRASNVLSGCTTQSYSIVLRTVGQFGVNSDSLHVISK